MRPAPALTAVAAGALALLALLSSDAAAQLSQYQPRLAFRVLSTDHFRIYYHQGQEPLARRLASIAEEVRADLPGRMRLEAPPVTHVVLVNQDDDANGWAMPIPYCMVRLNAVWPAQSELLGNTNDWLRTVFVHEYAHILHLNQSVGWAALWRSVFGRAPMAFPNLFLPEWQIEGLATYWETRAAGLGRLEGGDTADVVRNRALQPGGERIDRLNGGAVGWPGGQGPYLEGAWFYEYLYRRFGEEAVGRLSKVTAGRFPYLASPATRRVFGRSLGDLWADFQRDVRTEASALPEPSPPGRRLTTHGYYVSTPRFDATGQTLVYAHRDAGRFPALMALEATTGRVRKLVDRFAGSQVSVRGGVVVFDQLDLADNVAWRSDLFAADLHSGVSYRLTGDQRLLEPDLAPDLRRLACVRVADDGRRELAFFGIERRPDGRLSLHPVDVPVPRDQRATYGGPRWSPDGARLAVERRRLGGPSEIVVFDLEDGREQVTAASADARNIGPAWLPDGKTVLFASDRANRSFQIFAAAPDGSGLRRVSRVAGGAMSPEASPDGARLVYVGSDATGYDLFEWPLEQALREAAAEGPAPDAGGIPPPASTLPTAAGVAHSASSAEATVRRLPYSPVPTLLPRAWTPMVDTLNGSVRAGATLVGVDVLLRHTVAGSVMWRFGETTAVGGPHAARPDWSAGYTYARWRPSLYVNVSDTTSFITLAQSGAGAPEAELREFSAAVGVRVPFRRVHHQQAWQAEFDVERETRTWIDGPSSRYRNALRGAWTLNTAHRYGRSISAEDGIAAALTSEQVRAAFGADGNADAFTAEIRAYLRPGQGHGVIAARAGYGAAFGDRLVRRQFFVGGSSSAGGLVNFGTGAVGMVRGFDREVASGRRVAAASLEWRQPLWRIDRGWGTLPFFLKALHAAAFVDTGDAWADRFSFDRLRTSIGLEASLDGVAGYRLPLTLTAGVARTFDGFANRRATGFYLRVGPAF